MARLLFRIGLFSLIGGGVVSLSITLLWGLNCLTWAPNPGPSWFI